MKDFPMKLISLDWFELQKIIRSRGDIYNLSKHVKSRFLSSHRPSWHITRLQLQFKCPTKSIPIFNLNVPQNPLQWSSPISPKLRVPQKFPNFRFGFFIRHKFLNWNLNNFFLTLPFFTQQPPHKLIPYLFARSAITITLLSFFRATFASAPIVWD